MLLVGTRFETAAKTGRNWNDGTAELGPPSGNRTQVRYNLQRKIAGVGSIESASAAVYVAVPVNNAHDVFARTPAFAA